MSQVNVSVDLGTQEVAVKSVRSKTLLATILSQ